MQLKMLYLTRFDVVATVKLLLDFILFPCRAIFLLWKPMLLYMCVP